MTQKFESSNINMIALAQKLHGKAQTSNAPTHESLQILKSISALLVGMGSLYFPKIYGKKKTGENKVYQEVADGMIEEVSDRVKANLENALYLALSRLNL